MNFNSKLSSFLLFVFLLTSVIHLFYLGSYTSKLDIFVNTYSRDNLTAQLFFNEFDSSYFPDYKPVRFSPFFYINFFVMLLSLFLYLSHLLEKFINTIFLK